MSGIYSNVKGMEGEGGGSHEITSFVYVGDGSDTNIISDIPEETTNIQIKNLDPVDGYGTTIIDVVRNSTMGILNVPQGTYPVGAAWTAAGVTLTGDNAVTRGNVTGVKYICICYNFNK